MARVAVIGNCQAHGLINCLRFFQPSFTFTPFMLTDLKKAFAGAGALLARLKTFDVVVSMPPINGFLEGFDEASLAASCRTVIQCPLITFWAFHPDCIYVDERGTGARIHTPLGEYNSALALFAYTEGFGVEEAIRLFDGEVYQAVGYFEAWKTAEEGLFNTGIYYGFPFEKLYRSWLRRGVFMHTMNHPKLLVFADMAAEILRRCGIRADPGLAESYLADELLSNCVWPVYPELAQYMGVRGSYLFKAGTNIYNLREFVEGSYKRYQSCRTEAFCSARIEGWKQDAAFMEFIRSRALRRSSATA